MLRTTLLVVVLLLLGVRAAEAATVELRLVSDGRTEPGEDRVLYVAAPGEANELSVRSTPEAVEFRDAVPIVPGAGCERLDEQAAICRVPEVNPTESAVRRMVFIDLEDGDDMASVTGAASLRGGPGDDRLTGGPANDVLDGGPGGDALIGGAGHDTLDPGTPGAGPARDSMAGGDGRDTANFLFSRAGVVFDLATGELRTGGRTIAATGVQDALGSRFADRLSGTEGPNRLDGSGGDDRVDGRGGDDTVIGGDGRDMVRGGSGDDAVEDPEPADAYSDEGRNVLECGPGVDDVGVVSPLDTLGASCERTYELELRADFRRRAPVHLTLVRPSEVRRLTLDALPRRRSRRRVLDRGSPVPRRIRLGGAARALLRREGARRVLIDVRRRFEGDRTRFILDLAG